MTHNVFSNFAISVFSVLMFRITLPAQVPSPEATVSPTLKTRVEPKYTKQALQAGITGKAILFVRVDKNGVPTDVRFVKWNSPHGDNPLGLDKAAVEAVRQWRFYPQIKWGKTEPFPASIEVEFDFHRHPEQLPSQDEDRTVRV